MSTVATRRPAPGSGEVRTAELSIGGMTCASCAARIERRLSRLGDVAATVNLATQTARVRFPAAIGAADLIAAIEQAGYTATLAAAADGTQAATEEERATAEMARLLVSLALAVPVVVLAMVPAWQFRNWQWVSLALASAVALWGAWPFHRAAVRGARHGAATMDTLVSIGVSAAYLWSLYALFLAGGGNILYEKPSVRTTNLIDLDAARDEAAGEAINYMTFKFIGGLVDRYRQARCGGGIQQRRRRALADTDNAPAGDPRWPGGHSEVQAPRVVPASTNRCWGRLRLSIVPVRPATISTRNTGVPSSPNLRSVETNSRWYAAMARLSKRRQRRLSRGPISVLLMRRHFSERSIVRQAIDCSL